MSELSNVPQSFTVKRATGAQRPISIHNVAVQKIIDTYVMVETKGFSGRVRRILKATGIEVPRHIGIIPDAYIFDPEDCAIIAFEVEDTCRVSARKMERYIDLSWDLDEAHWSLGLVVTDRWGENVHQVDLLEYFRRQCVARMHAEGRKPDPKWVAWLKAFEERNPHLFADA